MQANRGVFYKIVCFFYVLRLRRAPAVCVRPIALGALKEGGRNSHRPLRGTSLKEGGKAILGALSEGAVTEGD